MDGSDPTEIPFTVDAEVAIGPEVEFEYPIEDTPTFTVKQIRDAQPSPDGSRIAFTALDRLYVAALRTAHRSGLTSDEVGEFQPIWSPDGRHVAYVTWDDDAGEGHIRRVSAEGGASAVLTTAPAYYRQIAWSPDGERIVARPLLAARHPGGGRPFRVQHRLGVRLDFVGRGDATVIGPTIGRRTPHFTDDPDRIYYYGTARADAVPGSPSPPHRRSPFRRPAGTTRTGSGTAGHCAGRPVRRRRGPSATSAPRPRIS